MIVIIWNLLDHSLPESMCLYCFIFMLYSSLKRLFWITSSSIVFGWGIPTQITHRAVKKHSQFFSFWKFCVKLSLILKIKNYCYCHSIFKIFSSVKILDFLINQSKIIRKCFYNFLAKILQFIIKNTKFFVHAKLKHMVLKPITIRPTKRPTLGFHLWYTFVIGKINSFWHLWNKKHEWEFKFLVTFPR